LFYFLQPLNLCDIDEATSVIVSKEDDLSKKVEITLKDPDKEVYTLDSCLRRSFKKNVALQNIVLSLEDRDADELILVLAGYYKLLTDTEIEVVHEQTEFSQTQGKKALLFEAVMKTFPARTRRKCESLCSS
jgi:hypothetical protein